MMTDLEKRGIFDEMANRISFAQNSGSFAGCLTLKSFPDHIHEG
jgi:hypothetical protein